MSVQRSSAGYNCFAARPNFRWEEEGKGKTYAVLLEIVRQVGDHNLGLGGDTILRGSALLALTGSSGLLSGRVLVGKRFVRGLCEGSNLAGYICGCALGGGSVGQLDLLGLRTVGVLANISI